MSNIAGPVLHIHPVRGLPAAREPLYRPLRRRVGDRHGESPAHRRGNASAQGVLSCRIATRPVIRSGAVTLSPQRAPGHGQPGPPATMQAYLIANSMFMSVDGHGRKPPVRLQPRARVYDRESRRANEPTDLNCVPASAEAFPCANRAGTQFRSATTLRWRKTRMERPLTLPHGGWSAHSRCAAGLRPCPASSPPGCPPYSAAPASPGRRSSCHPVACANVTCAA
jgi:hypothetical protein